MKFGVRPRREKADEVIMVSGKNNAEILRMGFQESLLVAGPWQ